MYTSIRELAADLADTLGLNRTAVERSISNHRQLFGRYENLTDSEKDRLARTVWADLTDGAEYPYD